ncbi:hypothetical protein SAMN05421677_107211 [Halobacillus aidingensis]|uniref:Uncharacterized protein n=1 Tax=Halobacillus aidingensis TaxID=240303 RepID=A0A1H0M3H2_HALAD|nr:hypothetical protein SAMN05421677_107211 [Halobacillus aidingensis]
MKDIVDNGPYSFIDDITDHGHIASEQKKNEGEPAEIVLLVEIQTCTLKPKSIPSLY